MLIDRLAEKSVRSPVCLGLDTRYEYLPRSIKEREDLTEGEKIALFNKRIIDATHDIVACYKIQIACYEALGLEGLKAYADTVDYAREAGAIVIGDIKRGDIGSTAAEYAKGHFSGDFETDMVTLNPYMGFDAVKPYTPYIEDKDKGLFILTHTSNPSAVDFQEQRLDDGEYLYTHVADEVAEWGEDYIGNSGFSGIGAVVGITYPEAFHELMRRHPHLFFLVPGYGTQGGKGSDLAEILRESRCAIVNNSRGLLTAHHKYTHGDDFIDYTRKATEAMRGDIFQWL